MTKPHGFSAALALTLVLTRAFLTDMLATLSGELAALERG